MSSAEVPTVIAVLTAVVSVYDTTSMIPLVHVDVCTYTV